MKGITVFLLFSASAGFSQSENDSIDLFAEQPAEFPGGLEKMQSFISKNLKYPPVMGCLQGNVFVRCVVEKDGSRSQITIFKGIPGCSECDEEALKVVEQMPKWIPAKNNGEAVRSYVNIPVTFRMH